MGGFNTLQNKGVYLTPTEVVFVQQGNLGDVRLLERTTPSTTTGVGHIYSKTDHKLYYLDGLGVEIAVGSGTFILPTLTSGSVLFSNGTTIAQDNANFFWDDANNYLGIGTAIPTQPLDVRFSESAGYISGISVKNTSTNTSGSYAGVLMEAENGVVKGDFTGAPSSALTFPGGGFLLRTITNHAIGFATNDTLRAVLDNTGQLGIGITSGIGAMLHISKAGTPEIRIQATGGGSLISTLNLYYSANNRSALSHDANAATAYFDNYYPGDITYGHINFRTNFAGNPTSRIFIRGDGNIGMGTTIPVSKLHTKTLAAADDGIISQYGHASPTGAAFRILNSVGDTISDFKTNHFTNVFLGTGAGRMAGTGQQNMFIGSYSGASFTTGGYNTAIGTSTLNALTTGDSNTAIGNSSQLLNQSNNSNTSIGYRSLEAAVTGASQNIAIGVLALNLLTTGDYNIAIGHQTLYSKTSGGTNTAYGAFAGYSNVTGTGNVFLGYAAGYSETGSNKLYIANDTTATPLIWGDFATQNLRFYYGATKRIETDSNGIGFFAATPIAKPAVTGSRGANAALASLLTQLAALGLITDSST